MDLLLSSGFLAFARHLGFLDALSLHSVDVDAIVGTSSGAMVGALWLAGHPLDDIAAELSRAAPLSTVRPTLTPWRGALSLQAAQDRLAAMLPARIEDLPKPFAVGVVDADGAHALLTEGPLAPAVMASCAMPHVFAPVRIEGRSYSDGGALDRLAVRPWRRWRPGRAALAHWVMRTAGVDVDVDLEGVTVVRTPRSGAKLWSLGDFEGQRLEAARITREALSRTTGS